MQINRIEIWVCLAVSLISNLSILSAAPQQLDLGIYKLSVDIENGFAIRKEINIDTPFLKINKTGEIGFGNPVVQRTDSDSEEDSYENQSSRRKREAVDDISTPNENLERKKRSPCHGGNGGNGGNTAQPAPEPSDVEEARRRRSAAAKILKAARKAKSSRKKARSKTGRRR